MLIIQLALRLFSRSEKTLIVLIFEFNQTDKMYFTYIPGKKKLNFCSFHIIKTGF